MDPQRFKVNNRPDPNRLPTDPLSKLPPPPPPGYAQKSKPGKPKWLTALIIFIVIVLGLAAWAFLSHKSKPTSTNTSTTKSQRTKANSNNSSSSTSAPSSSNVSTPSIPTTAHSSTIFSLSFNYPSAWNLVDSGAAGTTVTSPVMNLTAANGQPVQGQIELTLDKQGSIPSTFTTNSVAVMTSQKVQYTSPAQGQAASTYITFVQYPSTTTTGGLNGIYLTANYGYQKDQVIPSSDIAKIDPLIYFSFYSCASSSCPASSRTPLTIAGSTNWSNSSFQTPIMTILKSFSFD